MTELATTERAPAAEETGKITSGSKLRIHHRTCPLCEAMCGLDVHVADDTVTAVRPYQDDVWSKGYICPKGTALGYLHHDPDRLRAPMIREGDTWREVSWDEAFAECERLLARVRADGGGRDLAVYIGNPTVHTFGLPRYIGLFMALAGFGHTYSAGTVDQWPKNLSSLLMYGHPWRIPVPDLPRTDYLMMLGANPSASQGSLLAHAGIMREVGRIQARGGRVLVVDPRRTGTAAGADEWVPIMPGSDAAFLLAIVNVLFADGLVDLGDVGDVVAGVEEVREAARRFGPEDVADLCRVPADTIRRLARELAAAPSAAVYGRIGLCNQEFGTLASWLVDVVNVLTGNLDRAGGLMFARSLSWSFVTSPRPGDAAELPVGRWHTRVRGAPEVLGQVPVSCLGEEIGTPGEGQIRGLVTIAGNPVISAPGAARLDAALPKLECMISVDNYLNETTRHAHVILPGLSALEQPHYDETIWSWATRSAGKYSPAVFPPTDRPGEWEILVRLAAICAGTPAAQVDVKALDDGFFAGVVGMVSAQPGSAIHGRAPEEIAAAYDSGGPERILDFQIRVGPWGDAYGGNPGGLTLEEMKAHPEGVDMGPLEPYVREILATPSGKIELAPPYIVGDLDRLAARLGAPPPGMVLTSRRQLKSNNSWMHNVPTLVRGSNRCTLLVHPADAARLRLLDGEPAQVTSSAGSLVVPVQVSKEMMPGVVSLPHGWGHDRDGTRTAVASGHAGVNSNLLSPGDFVDVISGNAAVNGIPVEIVPVPA